MMFISKQILLIPSLLWIWAAFAYAQNQTLFCPEVCGRVNITYPFGVGDGCYRDKGFEITCNYTNNVFTPFLGINGFEVMEITTDQVRVPSVLEEKIYDKSGDVQVGTNSEPWDLGPGPFTFSSTRNVLSAVGCDIFAYITVNESQKSMAGCVSLCPNGYKEFKNGPCSGIGCCQTTIPLGLKALSLHVDTVNTETRSWDSSRERSWDSPRERSWETGSWATAPTNVSYAFLSDGPITWDRRDANFSLNESVVLDWAVGNETCKEAVRRTKNYACRANKSKCVNSTNGPGYRCKCSQGYEGNPYILHGCRSRMEKQVSNGNYIRIYRSLYASCPT